MTDLEREYEVTLIRAKLLMLNSRTLLFKEVHGAAFHGLGCLIATYVSPSKSLHSIAYTVVRKDGLPIGSSDSYANALADARRFLGAVTSAQQDGFLSRAKVDCDSYAKHMAEADKASMKARAKEWLGEHIGKPKVPKRRQAVFDKSEGKCHYCATSLTIGGKWHIEHKMPRALLGGSEQSNLVASCVSCNLRKRDKTDLEFIAKEAAA